jgi:hypothetical protein
MWKRSLALVLITTLTGCSMAVQGPAGRPTYLADGTPAEPDCTDSYAAPALDLVAATALVVAGAALVSCEPSHSDDPFADVASAGVCGGAIILGVPVLIGGAVEAGVGLGGSSKVAACKRAKAEYHQRMAAAAVQPATFMPPPTEPVR